MNMSRIEKSAKFCHILLITFMVHLKKNFYTGFKILHFLHQIEYLNKIKISLS
jgi:hypothetical protein